MLKYLQRTGQLFHLVQGPDSRWELLGTGYAGVGEGLNNPEAEDKADVGPIPSGLWSVSFPYDDPKRGINAFKLTPLTYRGPRSGFLIHADNRAGNHTASEGCIILDSATRSKLATSKYQYLLVEAGPVAPTLQ